MTSATTAREEKRMHELFKTLGNIGLVPVIKIDDAGKAAALGKALLKGGLPVAEVTFRTAAAEEAIRRMSGECPGLIVGAGTVINPDLAKKAIAAGAKFIVSPGFNPATVDYCLERGVPILPGANNPSLIEEGLSKGLEVFKFFPAEASGGLAMINALAAPFGTIKFVPTGGIDAANLSEYAKNDAILAIGGSWMVKAELIGEDKWDDISALCA
jgi:2-dehydro-3-deoxyphosphogluconate aldolase/(4S)-4-hydroxy-2-oxoglutarate aldolase